ncbi:MAG: hypothetical protein ACT4PT_04885, partial [Methanobacteriota archaeon]
VSAGPDAADPSRPYAFSLQNQAPTVHFTSPPALSVVRGNVQLRWTASDADNTVTAHQLLVTIRVARAGASPVTIVSEALNSGSTEWNTTAAGFLNGNYTATIEVSDGELSGDNALFLVLDNPRATPVEIPTDVEIGAEATFSVRVTHPSKTPASVVAIFYRADTVKARQTMDAAGAGVYSTSYAPDQAGTWRMGLQITYTDGSTEPVLSVQSFRVERSAIRENFALFLVFLLAAVAAIGLAAYGAFVRWPP